MDNQDAAIRPITIAEMAGHLDQPEWIVARSMARLIAKGLLSVSDGTAEQAVATLRAKYGEAVNGE